MTEDEKTIKELLKEITKKLTNIESEIETTKAIGEEIGYVQLINIAMALWRKFNINTPTEHTLDIDTYRSIEVQKVYDTYIKSYYDRKSTEITTG